MGLTVKDTVTLISGSGGIGKVQFASKCIDSFALLDDKNEIYAFGRSYQYSLGLTTDQTLNSFTKIPFDLNAILTAKNTFVRDLRLDVATFDTSPKGYYHNEQTIITLDDGSFLVTGGRDHVQALYQGFTLIDTFVDKPYTYPASTQPYTAIEEEAIVVEPTVEMIADEVKQLRVEIDEKENEIQIQQDDIKLKQKEIDEKLERLTNSAKVTKKVVKKK